MFPKYSKKSFSNLVDLTGDETWVNSFEPEHKCSSRVWATKNAVHLSEAKPQRMIKKILYECVCVCVCVCFFFFFFFLYNKGLFMQLPVTKDRTVTGTFYKNVVLKKLKAHFKRHRPKAGLKYLHLQHDNASAHKVHCNLIS